MEYYSEVHIILFPVNKLLIYIQLALRELITLVEIVSYLKSRVRIRTTEPNI